MKSRDSAGAIWFPLLSIAVIGAFVWLYTSLQSALGDIGHAVDLRLANSSRLEDASRFQVEYDRLTITLHEMADGSPEVTPEDVRLNFDILWSRAETLGSGGNYALVSELGADSLLFEKTMAALRKAEPLVHSFPVGDHDALKKVTDIFADVGPAIAEFGQAAFQVRRLKAVEAGDAQRIATIKLDRAQMAFLGFGLLTPLLLTLEIYRVRRLNNEIKRREDEIIRMGLTDALTGLGNRRALYEHLSKLDVAGKGFSGSLLLLDLDGFKAVNDDYGHLVGDELLKQAAARLGQLCAPAGEVYRLGGDEFAIVTSMNVSAAEGKSAAIIDTLSEPFTIENRDISVSVSVGIAELACNGASSPESFLGNADVALYEAKNHGRHCWRVFTTDLRDGVYFHNAVSASLPRAVQNGEITVSYQPQLELETGRIVGVEALSRWVHPVLGEISPQVFINKAEQLGLIKQLDQHVLSTACRDIQSLNRSGADLHLSVNVSPLEAGRRNFSTELLEQIAKLRFARNRLTLELTENAVMENSEAVAANLGAIAEAGIKVAIDDFGSGYSNLSYLTRFEFAYLKVDRSLTAKVGNDKKANAVMAGIQQISSHLNLKLVLEGIETDAQLDFARLIKADLVQGFRISRPMTYEELRSYILPARNTGQTVQQNSAAA